METIERLKEIRHLLMELDLIDDLSKQTDSFKVGHIIRESGLIADINKRQITQEDPKIREGGAF